MYQSSFLYVYPVVSLTLLVDSLVMRHLIMRQVVLTCSYKSVCVQSGDAVDDAGKTAVLPG